MIKNPIIYAMMDVDTMFYSFPNLDIGKENVCKGVEFGFTPATTTFDKKFKHFDARPYSFQRPNLHTLRRMSTMNVIHNYHFGIT